MEMNTNTRTIDLYMTNGENEFTAIRDFNSKDYINTLLEECRNNDYELVLDYFTTDEDDMPETHYWNIKMIPESCTYEVMFNEHYEILMEQFRIIAESDSPENLSDALCKVYEQYLKPLMSNDKVKEAYERYEYVGDAYAAYLMTAYAQRLYKLMELGTPAVIINNEKRYFINAMIASSAWVRDINSINRTLNNQKA